MQFMASANGKLKNPCWDYTGWRMKNRPVDQRGHRSRTP